MDVTDWRKTKVSDEYFTTSRQYCAAASNWGGTELESYTTTVVEEASEASATTKLLAMVFSD